MSAMHAMGIWRGSNPDIADERVELQRYVNSDIQQNFIRSLIGYPNHGTSVAAT